MPSFHIDPLHPYPDRISNPETLMCPFSNKAVFILMIAIIIIGNE